MQCYDAFDAFARQRDDAFTRWCKNDHLEPSPYASSGHDQDPRHRDPQTLAWLEEESRRKGYVCLNCQGGGPHEEGTVRGGQEERQDPQVWLANENGEARALGLMYNYGT